VIIVVVVTADTDGAGAKTQKHIITKQQQQPQHNHSTMLIRTYPKKHVLLYSSTKSKQNENSTADNNQAVSMIASDDKRE
jgi:hypothetical protein